MEAYTEFSILDSGNLKISLTESGKQFIHQMPDEYNSDTVLAMLCEYQTCAEAWEWLQPWEIGALTDAPILGLDVETDCYGAVISVAEVYWYPQYDRVNPIEALMESGYIIFQGE